MLAWWRRRRPRRRAVVLIGLALVTAAAAVGFGPSLVVRADVHDRLHTDPAVVDAEGAATAADDVSATRVGVGAGSSGHRQVHDRRLA